MSVGNILSKLQEFNNSNLISVYVPSAGKKMTFKALSVKQQKDLIKTGLDGALAGVTITNIINQIVLDNSTEKYNFLSTDKIPIILALRKHSFGSIAVIKEEDSEISFDLDDILTHDLDFPFKNEETIVMNDANITTTVAVVSLLDDIKINEFQLDKLRKNKDGELSDTIGSLFIYEIVKFVTKLEVNSSEIDLRTLPVKDRLTVVENIPASMNNLILGYIQKFRKMEMDYITVGGNVLPIDARLFSSDDK